MAGAFRATVIAELRLRFRTSGLVVRLAVLVILCALLVPPDNASYTVLSIDGMRPAMSADTALLAASLVLSTLIIPVYGLWLDLGRNRDAARDVRELILTVPQRMMYILNARLCAGGITAFISIIGALLILAVTVLTRYGSWPGGQALLLCFCITGVAGGFATVLGAGAELLGGRRTAIRVIVVFAAWSAAIVMAVTRLADLIGFKALIAMIGNPAAARSLSFGFIRASDTVYDWRRFAVSPRPLILAMGLRLLLIAAVGVIVAALASLMSVKSACDVGRAAASPRMRAWVEDPSVNLQVRSAAESRPKAIASGMVIARRMFRRSRFGGIALLAGFALGCVPSVPQGVAMLVILAFPFVVLANISAAEARVVSSLERTEPAFLRIGNGLTTAAALIGLMVVAALPALLRMAPVQAATAVAALSAVAFWLELCCRHLDRPILGVAVALLAIYVAASNPSLPAADLFGLWHSSAAALAVSASLTGLTAAVLAKVQWR